MFNAKEAVILE